MSTNPINTQTHQNNVSTLHSLETKTQNYKRVTNIAFTCGLLIGAVAYGGLTLGMIFTVSHLPFALWPLTLSVMGIASLFLYNARSVVIDIAILNANAAVRQAAAAKKEGEKITDAEAALGKKLEEISLTLRAGKQDLNEFFNSVCRVQSDLNSPKNPEGIKKTLNYLIAALEEAEGLSPTETQNKLAEYKTCLNNLLQYHSSSSEENELSTVTVALQHKEKIQSLHANVMKDFGGSILKGFPLDTLLMFERMKKTQGLPTPSANT